ncbi:UL25 DNA packaging protein [Meleagrid alphaherpesvirus 1]|uniref:UL25 DNA packaging protein n=1 Tax=Meleagrid herpesvirus 1 TaxID=37108 RepID=Q9DPR2_MEHV1|nr:DNA packaging tegument protein UL25 [Meleagrid alphaherpesvirus 1]AKQ48602.1 DNA packaging tegument protein UL25 [iBAC vector pMeHV1-C7]AKQ48674.1 DNA packaging tegument protein UL25 [iBAC vector pMeHV1-C9]AKQ48746.1 DNA packaging tegument protein UL25 [iBAC vector pMeHV1-C10]AKQ48818.1 DNA packaging tegument protein UL25 [iBAC vector pMeHV1-C17]AKQ48890.1 DNA packaging tegument protein UL25 [iBAC vector pMeHV1-C18]
MSRDMVNFIWGARIMGNDHLESHPADTKNFIAPRWPIQFWKDPAFTDECGALEKQLALVTARNKAAAAALDDLDGRTNTIAVEVDRRLRPLEDKLKEMASTLADLEQAASAAELADAAADAELPASVSSEPRKDDSCAENRIVKIAKNDPALRYVSNLPVDLLNIIYASRGAASAGVLFGTWYRALQNMVITERPHVARKIDYHGGRMSRTFMTTVVTILQSCGRLYVGKRQYSSFECAVLCLYAFFVKTGHVDSHPSNFTTAIESVPTYLDHLASKIVEVDYKPKYGFDAKRLPKDYFEPPSGKYERDALIDHSVLKVLVKYRVLPPAMGSIPRGCIIEDVDKNQTAYDDDVNSAAAALLGRAQPLFLMEDQTLLRSTLNTIASMLFLRRLLWNTNIYSAKINNLFQLGSFVPGTVSSVAVGASVATPESAIRSDGRNLLFLFQKYVAPIYNAIKGVELTQLFPGLVALCLDVPFFVTGMSDHKQPPARIIDTSLSKYQTTVAKLVSLELENRNRGNVASIKEVIAAHDSVTLQYEHGLELLMQIQQPRARLFESRKLIAFNVQTDYDLLYFACLGYIPKLVSAP